MMSHNDVEVAAPITMVAVPGEQVLAAVVHCGLPKPEDMGGVSGVE